ncbi:MAG: hypothetical protein F4213_18870 [Boseongicola sp. SB0677_bin_26]|nr:hypothetical protein [Boseongicola sp. SB0665_bin_10]MYG28053.1 hypothetical protein [Boseongicola sp. SB0677_bin_26]
MNALRARHDGLPVVPHGEGAAWHDAVPAPDPADEAMEDGARAMAAPPPLPVPVPPVPASLAAEDGTRLVAGLEWETASGPEAPVVRADAPSVLRLADRRARLAHAEGESCGSLLLAMAEGLARIAPEASGPWAFIAEIPDAGDVPLLWMAVADIAATKDGGTAARVTPRPGPEGTFEDADEALAALEGHLSVTDVAGIAVCWTPVRPGMTPEDTFRGPVIQGLARTAPDVPLHDVEPAAGTPAFLPPGRVPVRLLGGLGIAGAAVTAVVLYVVPAVQALVEGPAPLPPETVAVAIPPGAFAAACTGTLDAWWPRVTGWRAESAGCALSGHLPRAPALPEPQATERLGRSMAVWRHLAPEPGRNAVLARAAAEQMMGTWPHEARLDADGLTLWKTASVPLARAETAGQGTPSPGPDAVRSRLAALWADAPNAVTRGGGQDAGGENLFTVRAPGSEPAALVLSRAAAVQGIAPVRLVQSADGGTELVLAPVTPRQVPLALLDAAKAQSLDGGSTR